MGNRITFKELAAYEPRLKELLTKARRVRQSKDFCASEVFYSKFKPVICKLVGWARKNDAPILATESAYDEIYDTIWAALPNCNHESAFCSW